MQCPDHIENALEGLTLEIEADSSADLFEKYFAETPGMNELIDLGPEVELLAHNGKTGADREVYLELSNGLGAYCIQGEKILWAHTDAAELHRELGSGRCELTIHTIIGFRLLPLDIIEPISEFGF